MSFFSYEHTKSCEFIHKKYTLIYVHNDVHIMFHIIERKTIFELRRVSLLIHNMVNSNMKLHLNFYLNNFTYNLFVTSKNETTNSLIHEFKALYKGQRAF